MLLSKWTKVWFLAMPCDWRLTAYFCSGLCHGSLAGISLDSETAEERGASWNNLILRK